MASEASPPISFRNKTRLILPMQIRKQANLNVTAKNKLGKILAEAETIAYLLLVQQRPNFAAWWNDAKCQKQTSRLRNHPSVGCAPS